MSKWQVTFKNYNHMSKELMSTVTKSFDKKEDAEAEIKLWSRDSDIKTSLAEVPDNTKDTIINHETSAASPSDHPIS